MRRRPLRRRHAGGTGEQEQRLGGSRPIDPASVHCPPGFRVSAVAAGFTSPCAVALDDGLLYVVERGQPRRTGPRALRVDPGSGTASVVAELSAAGFVPFALPFPG